MRRGMCCCVLATKLSNELRRNTMELLRWAPGSLLGEETSELAFRLC